MLTRIIVPPGPETWYTKLGWRFGYGAMINLMGVEVIYFSGGILDFNGKCRLYSHTIHVS